MSRELAAIKEGGYLSASLFPRDRLYFAGVEFLNAALDLIGPGCLHDRVRWVVVEAFEERPGKGSSRLGRKSQGFLEEIRNFWSHGNILRPGCEPRIRNI